MTRNYFIDFFEEQGCRINGNIAMGVNSQGMPYSVMLNKTGKSPVLTMRFALNQPASAFVKLFNENPMQYVNVLVYNEILEYTLNLPTDFYTKATIHSIHSLTAQLCEATGIEPATTCPLCNLEKCDVHAWLTSPGNETEQAFYPSHANCLETKLDENAENKEIENKIPGSYWRGALGALLGAFVGTAPSWLQLISKGKPSAVLYFIIPIFSALVYRLFRGKRKHAYASVCIIISCIISAFLFEQYGFNYSLYYAGGYVFTYTESLKLYINNITFAEAVKNMGLSLLFMFIGFVPASRLMQGYSRLGTVTYSTVYGTAFSRQSAMPILEENSSIENEINTTGDNKENSKNV